MNNDIKEYIENNIGYLDNKNYYFFLLNATTDLGSNTNLKTLIDILYEIEDDKDLIDTARENVLRFYITMKIEDYADDEYSPLSYSIYQFVFRYLSMYIGYTVEEIMDFILDNRSEWIDNMVEKNGEWMVCK